MSGRPTPAQLASLALETERQAPIDWGLLAISEEDAYQMMASQVLEMIETMPADRRETVMMATMTRLLVENFALNARLMGAEKR